MYQIKTWDKDLDLNDFYKEAETRGFLNNSNQKTLVDSLAKENKWAVWILYYNEIAVGSFAAHSLPELGDNAYRICVRTCVLSRLLPRDHMHHMRTLKGITQHQNITAQFYIPKCIEWAGKGKNLYISTNTSNVGTQRLVHEICCPALVKIGALVKHSEIEYRGHLQTFWKLNAGIFLEQLSNERQWK
jgi:hypothetical protein